MNTWKMSVIGTIVTISLASLIYFVHKQVFLSRYDTLFAAVQQGNVDRAELLIAEGLDPNFRRLPSHSYDRIPGTPARPGPIHFAALAGNQEMARMLLKHGADPNLSSGSSTGAPLDFVVRGARLFQQDNGGAVPQRFADFARILLDTGAKSSSMSNSGAVSLGDAAVTRSPELLTQLLRLDLSPEALINGLEAASYAGANDSFAMLAERSGLEVLLRALFVAARVGDEGFLRDLLRRRLDVNSRDPEGSAPLHLAALHCRTKCVLALLEYGALRELKDARGRLPWELAEDKALVTLLRN